jgi:hypothetical protein
VKRARFIPELRNEMFFSSFFIFLPFILFDVTDNITYYITFFWFCQGGRMKKWLCSPYRLVNPSAILTLRWHFDFYIVKIGMPQKGLAKRGGV